MVKVASQHGYRMMLRDNIQFWRSYIFKYGRDWGVKVER